MLQECWELGVLTAAPTPAIALKRICDARGERLRGGDGGVFFERVGEGVLDVGGSADEGGLDRCG